MNMAESDTDFDASLHGKFEVPKSHLSIVKLGDPYTPDHLYSPLRGVLSGSPACAKDCSQGRVTCPTPEACRIAEGEPGRDSSWIAMTWGEIVAMAPALWPILLVGVCAVVAHFLAAK